MKPVVTSEHKACEPCDGKRNQNKRKREEAKGVREGQAHFDDPTKKYPRARSGYYDEEAT